MTQRALALGVPLLVSGAGVGRDLPGPTARAPSFGSFPSESGALAKSVHKKTQKNCAKPVWRASLSIANHLRRDSEQYPRRPDVIFVQQYSS